MTSQTFGRYATVNVPRYTSYPTAPHFNDTVDGAVYQSWLHELDPNQPISLYLHVPFCRQICWYCGCNMKLAARHEPVAEYTQVLIQEIKLIADQLPTRMKVSHLHWGGGTPNVLMPHELRACMAAIHERFDMMPDAEIAFECDPRTLTKEMIQTVGDLGFTRASFGVQEFDPTVQKAINRVQPPEMVRKAVNGFRAAGVSAINFDLIYGLPHQTTQMLQKTIRICTAMRPDRIALFGYAHVPWVAKKQRLIPEEALPGTEARIEQAEKAALALRRAGYRQIGLDHFALPHDSLAEAAKSGTLRRNFQGYTTDTAQALLGLGATSIGRTPSGYVQNIRETGAWARAVQSGNLPVQKGLRFVGEDRLRADVIEQIMCQGRTDLVEAARKHNAPENWYADAAGPLTDLVREGLIDFADGRLVLTEQGRTLSRVVASTFDEYLPTAVGRHAVAV